MLTWSFGTIPQKPHTASFMDCSDRTQLIPLGETKTTTVSEVNLKQAFKYWPGRWTVTRSIPRILREWPQIMLDTYKSKPQRLHTSLLTYFLHVCLYMTGQVYPLQLGQPTLFMEMKTLWLVTVPQHPPAFQEVVCTWASGAHRLEAFLIYRSLEQSN